MVGAWHTSSQTRGILVSIATSQIKRRCNSFSEDSTSAEEAEAVTEGEVAAAYPWVAAAAVAAMMARRSRNPGTNGLPSPPPAGGPPHPTVPSSGLAFPLGVPPLAPVPKPPGTGRPLLALVDILPGAHSELHALVAAQPGGLLVPGAVSVSPKGRAGRLRFDRPVPDL